METVYFLAQLYGFSLIIIGLALILRPRNVVILSEIITHEQSLFSHGLVKLILGITTLLAYHSFTKSWETIIPILGCLLILGGVVRLYYPELVVKTAQKFKANNNWSTFASTALVFVGCVLLYFSFAS